jgi:multicomponent Na+:H+ antiporter subunit E
MRRAMPTVVWLAAVWVALWKEVSVANLLGGLAAGVLAVVLVPPRPARGGLTVRPLALVHLAAYFLGKLIEASAVVAWEVATPRNRIKEAIVAVPLHGDTDLLNTLVANAVSLTPGTLSLELIGQPRVLYVHVLHLKDVESVRRDIGHLEGLAEQALAARPRQASTTSADCPGKGRRWT